MTKSTDRNREMVKSALTSTSLAATVAARGIGDNAARPIDLATERVDELVAAADQWLAKVPKIKDEVTAARAEDFLKQLRDTGKFIEAQHIEARSEAAAVLAGIDAPWKINESKIATCIELIIAKRRVYLIAEENCLFVERVTRQRIADEAARKAEEAARRAQQPNSIADVTRAQRLVEEAAEAQKAADAVPWRAQVRGALSGRASSLRRSWKATAVTDIAEACSWAIENCPVDLKAWLIIMASHAARSGQHEIPGFKVEEELS